MLGIGQAGGKFTSKQFTGNLSALMLFAAPSGCQGTVWLCNLDPFSCLLEPALKVRAGGRAT